ncbi:MAG: OmpH family outer membrane protein [Deltaproteobacteria bacterium]|nr:OmpH family outer membrane protein [Deltaproteobacteria bacterium]
MASAVPAAAQGVKLGFVDIQKALMTVNEGKSAKSKLEKIAKSKQAELDKMQDDIKRLATELQEQGAVMRDETKRQKAQEYQKRLMELQDYYLNNQKTLAEEEAKLTRPILERFEKILKKIGKDEGYTMIMEKAAVVYASSATDLTDRLIADFNGGAGK